MKNFLLIVLSFLLMSGCSTVERAGYVLKPQLTSGDIKVLGNDEIEGRLPFQQNPAALYEYSKRLVQEGNLDRASFWFYAGQLRLRTLGHVTGDTRLAAMVESYRYNPGDSVNSYLMKDARKWAEVIDRVIEWDKTSGSVYQKTAEYTRAHDQVVAGLIELRGSVQKKYGQPE